MTEFEKAQHWAATRSIAVRWHKRFVRATPECFEIWRPAKAEEFDSDDDGFGRGDLDFENLTPEMMEKARIKRIKMANARLGGKEERDDPINRAKAGMMPLLEHRWVCFQDYRGKNSETQVCCFVVEVEEEAEVILSRYLLKKGRG